MNFHLKNLPERTKKTRDKGLTMVIDKGSSINECKNLIESSGEFIDIVKRSDSPGLLVNIYLQKFNEIINCISNIVINNGSWFSIPLYKIIIKPIDKERKIIPNISDNPAIAWLNEPIFLRANSSVKTKSWNE